MKIIVLCCKGDKSVAVDIIKLLKTLRLNAAAFIVGEAWRTEKRRLDEVLAPATHVIAVLTDRSAFSTWLPFVAGLSIGSERPLVLYRPSRSSIHHAYLAPFFLLLSLESVSSFLEAESSEWHAIAERRNARRELLELGVSFRGESFADTVREGNAHAVELFIKAGLPADTRDKRGVPLLCLAVREGNRSIADLMLSNGANVDLQSEDRGNSALMDAAAGARADIIEDLLKNGASVDLQ
ncbi:MAG: ankyrin repeat domain-containing protein, partial [Treponemataceae bacterium]